MSIEEQIKEAAHKFDLLMHPYVVYVNPLQKEMLEKALKEIDGGDQFVIMETPFVENRQILVAERRKLEELEKPSIDFDMPVEPIRRWR